MTAPLVLLALLASCSAAPTSSVDQTPAPTPPDIPLPALAIDGLRARQDTADASAVAAEAADPAAVEHALTDSGFVGARERTYTGRLGVFSRVVLRAWAFTSAAGASRFLAWLRTNAAQLIGTSARVDASLPAGVSLALHRPSGCCHEEVPIYLAAWQRGPLVWTIRASGARIRTAPVLALVRKVEGEV